MSSHSVAGDPRRKPCSGNRYRTRACASVRVVTRWPLDVAPPCCCRASLTQSRPVAARLQNSLRSR